MYRLRPVLLFAALLLALSVCAGAKPSGMTATATKLFKTQLTCMSKGDVKGYMATIDPSSPVYNATKAGLEALPLKKITAVLNKLKVVSESKSEAKVRTTITTTAKGIPGFRNNVVIGLNTLKLVKGKWLLHSTKVEKVDYK